MRRWVQRAVQVVVVGLVVAAAPAAVAVRSATAEAAAPAAKVACEARSTTRPFAQWGDNNAYFTVPDGTFASNAAGWTTSAGVSVVADNEPWKVLPGPNNSALSISGSGSATTPSLCIASDEDSTRFFYRSPGVRGSKLHVSIYVTSGVNVATNDYDVDGSSAGWAVGPRIMLPDIRDSSGRQTVKITFSVRGKAATWLVDDVLVDPWRSL